VIGPKCDRLSQQGRRDSLQEERERGALAGRTVVHRNGPAVFLNDPVDYREAHAGPLPAFFGLGDDEQAWSHLNRQSFLKHLFLSRWKVTRIPAENRVDAKGSTLGFWSCLPDLRRSFHGKRADSGAVTFGFGDESRLVKSCLR
jgi:hypothetical protein